MKALFSDKEKTEDVLFHFYSPLDRKKVAQ